jgi:hypothetical protein
MSARKQNKGTARKPRDPLAELPFVKDTPKARRNFWSVKKSDDPMQQSRIGTDYALAWLRYEVRPENNGMDTCLACIVGDMPRKLGHIEIAFLSMVGFAAKKGLSEAERINAYWNKCEAADAA